MAYSVDLEQRLKDAIGESSDTIFGALHSTTQLDIVTDALWIVARSLPHELLLDKAGAATAYTVNNASATAISDKVLLHVVKKSGDGLDYIAARKIPITESQKALDTNSIYKATNNSPVYWLDEGKLKLAPDTANVTHYDAKYYAYTKQIPSALGNSLTNFPQEAFSAVVYLAGANMINNALHTFSEDESPEEYAGWKAHSATLMEMFRVEMSVIKGKEGGEEA